MPDDKSNEYRILLVDDQYSSVTFLEEKLAQLGARHELRWASTFREAAHFVADWNPNIVLLDVHMPSDGDEQDNTHGRHAFDFCENILSDYDELVVAFLSADYNAELVSMAEDVGAYTYIQKHTLDVEVLKELIRQV